MQIQSREKPSALLIDAQILDNGIAIIVNGESLPITYPKEVWQKTSAHFKEILKDSLALASTLYIPQILGIREAHYKSSRPLSECFFLRNGIYDAPYCANVDGESSRQYLHDFFNTRYLFKDETIKVPQKIDFSQRKPTKKALVLFSFGKESLLSFALCKELGIEPVLVTIIHPGFEYEWKHKEPLVHEFEKEFKTKVHTIRYEPGWLKEGKFWGLSTELGWGLHVTEYALLALPFAEVFDCDYVVCGNEQSCNDIYYDVEDILIYRAGLDQHKEWTKQQGLLQSMLIGRKLEAVSFLEPLYEIVEMKLLHHRYPTIGKYQMSCFAADAGAKNRRWCQRCEKCAYMYALLRGFNIDPASLGFTENLFDEAHKDLYETFFTRTEDSHYYGNKGELGLGYYGALKHGAQEYSVKRFEKELLPDFHKHFESYAKKYLIAHPTDHMPPEHHAKLFEIFNREIAGCLEK